MSGEFKVIIKLSQLRPIHSIRDANSTPSRRKCDVDATRE